MTDTAQLNLREPEQVDWDNLGKSTYAPPPPAFGPDGKRITYYGVPSSITEEPDQLAEGYISFHLQDVKIVRSGNGSDGYTIKFTRANAKPKTKAGSNGERVPIKGNPTSLAEYLRACGLQAKPQTNDQYRAAVRQASGRPFGFVIDWEAYNKDTGERVKGYFSFPDDPERPGHKKSVLKRGDLINVTDAKGNVIETQTVQSEVLFANARIRFFRDPSRKDQQ